MGELEVDVDDLEIIVGTYEEFILGYRVTLKDDQTFNLVQSFATHSHRASVRSLARSDKYLASGGSDESIILYDMSSRKEAGLLMHHNGTISCLEFAPNGSHLLSGCEDGSIGACRTGSWQLEKLWGKAHKGSAVTSVSVHPSGKLFLSVGTDGTVRTWNFVKGRPAYTTILCKPKEARLVSQVLWSPDGNTYAVVIGTRVEIFGVEEASVVYTIQLDTKITCISYIDSEVICSASEEGDVFLHDIVEMTLVGQFKAHQGRVRCLQTFKSEWIVTASSEGEIKLWWKKDPKNILCVSGASTGCRITCMSLCIDTTPGVSHMADVKPVDLCALNEELVSKPPQKPLGYVKVEVDGELPEKNVSKKRKRKREGTGNQQPVFRRQSDEVKEPKRKKKKKKNLIDVVDVEVQILEDDKNKPTKKEGKRVSFGEVTYASSGEVVRNEANGLPKKKRNKRLVESEIEVLDKISQSSQTSNAKKKKGILIDYQSGEGTPQGKSKLKKSKRGMKTKSPESLVGKFKKKKLRALQSGMVNSPSGCWSVN